MVTIHGASPTWSAVEHFGYLETLSVDPVARGQGIGTALLDAVRARLSARGVVRIELTAVAANTRVRAFYERQGFGVPFVRMAAEGPPPAPGT